MNKSIKLLIEGFFDDDIFNIDNDIEDLGRYYDYNVGEIYYQNKKPYAICCGEAKYFNDNKPRFCLLNDSVKRLDWRIENELVKELGCFEFDYFYLNSFNDFRHIDEEGYRNTLIIKNNYDLNEFPAFEYCLNLGDNVYLPAIDELLIMYLNKDKLGKYSFSGYLYWSSTLRSVINVHIINADGYFGAINKYYKINVRPFSHLD